MEGGTGREERTRTTRRSAEVSCGAPIHAVNCSCAAATVGLSLQDAPLPSLSMNEAGSGCLGSVNSRCTLPPDSTNFIAQLIKIYKPSTTTIL